MKSFSPFFGILLDLLFPKYCLGCYEDSENFYDMEKSISPWLCAKCFQNIPLNNNPRCPYCELRFTNYKPHKKCSKQLNLDGILFATFYDNSIIQLLVSRLKYSGIRDLSIPLAALISSYLMRISFPFYEYLLIPVPLSSYRKRCRGYNQAELIAHHLSHQLHIQMQTSILKRTVNTPAQTIFSSDKERKLNVRNAFTCSNPRAIEKRRIFIVDDVTTSGATLRECAKALHAAKPASIWGLAVAGRH